MSWDIISKYVLPVLGAVGGIISGMMGAGPIGGIIGGVAGIALTIIGVVFYNKYKKWQFENAHKQEKKQEQKDHEQFMKDADKHAQSDEEASAQSKKNKENAFKEDT